MTPTSVVSSQAINLFAAALIVSSWAGHLFWFTQLKISFDVLSIFQILAHCLVQTFLFTGLFITAHDAMHDTVAPKNKRLNDFIGGLCTFLYAGFAYRKLRSNHHLHHAKSGTFEDPDFAANHDERFHSWLWTFATRYYGLKEFARMHIHVFFLWWLSGSATQVIICFAIPAWLSAIQLFWFGTFLPHRTKGRRSRDLEHKARSNDYPVWLSFITCYHFGFHLEHHQKPYLPWWALPRSRADLKK